MPFPLNWSEELLSEYLELDGYFVRTNIPVPTEGTGGRRDLDIIGVKREKEQFKIIHVETGIPSNFDEIKRRFLPFTKKKIDQIANNFGFEEYTLESWYIQSWGEQKGTGTKYKQFKSELEKEDIVLMTFGEILTKIAYSINKWRNEHKKTQKATVPANLWLLKLLEALLLSKKLTIS